jgi:hypothetical protein
MYITIHKSLDMTGGGYIRISHIKGDIYYIRHSGFCQYIYLEDLIVLVMNFLNKGMQ